jgi:flavin reductase (DIM6/NTAB) family NADH-FMN oxidoreductase RutF
VTITDHPTDRRQEAPSQANGPAIAPLTFRRTLSGVPTSVALVTATSPDGEPIGMVVGTFISVSLEPPLVSFIVSKTSRTWRRLRGCDRLCINILAASQRSVCSAFTGPDPQKFTNISWGLSSYGLPVVAGSSVVIDCQVDQLIEAGDHDIVLCRVLAMTCREGAVQPLVFCHGRFGTYASV